MGYLLELKAKSNKEMFLLCKLDVIHFKTQGKSSTMFSAVPCGNLTADPNGAVTAGPFVYQDTADYTCDTGYAFCTGGIECDTVTVTCQADQTWSQGQPVCYSESLF